MDRKKNVLIQIQHFAERPRRYYSEQRNVTIETTRIETFRRDFWEKRTEEKKKSNIISIERKYQELFLLLCQNTRFREKLVFLFWFNYTWLNLYNFWFNYTLGGWNGNEFVEDLFSSMSRENFGEDKKFSFLLFENRYLPAKFLSIQKLCIRNEIVSPRTFFRR